MNATTSFILKPPQYICFLLSIIIPLVTGLSGCWSSVYNDALNALNKRTAVPGDRMTLMAGSVAYTIIYTNSEPGVVFPTGIDDSGTATVERPFYTAETEVTNALMVEVMQWAYNNGKFSDTFSDHNGIDSTMAKYGGRQILGFTRDDMRVKFSEGTFFVSPVSYEEHPAVQVTWYGAIMFCNWLTEMRDGHEENVVYSGMDADWEHTETVEDASKTGYRLPSTEEWEFAARWEGREPGERTYLVARGDNGGDPGLTEGYYWIPGNYASGAYTWYNDYGDINPENGMVDNRDSNDAVAVYARYWDGGYHGTGMHYLQEVRSKEPNSLGLIHMSGNLWEWCYTENGGSRYMRGASYLSYGEDLQVGLNDTSYTPESCSLHFGIRFVRTVE